MTIRSTNYASNNVDLLSKHILDVFGLFVPLNMHAALIIVCILFFNLKKAILTRLALWSQNMRAETAT